MDAVPQKIGGCNDGKLNKRRRKFGDKQILAIEILSQPKRGGLLYSQVADAVGVDEKTLFRWRQNPEFVEAITRKAIMNLHADLPEVFSATLNRAKAGEVRSVDLLLKLVGLMVDKAEIEVAEKGNSNEDIAEDIKRLKEMLNKQG